MVKTFIKYENNELYSTITIRVSYNKSFILRSNGMQM